MSEPVYQPFGACLSSLLARHNLSAATVSRMLGHKSRTTLRRILQDEANCDSMERFWAEFCEARLIPLTAEEEEEIRRSLAISRLGLSGFRARAEMWRLFHHSDEDEPQAGVFLTDMQTGDRFPIDQFFRMLSHAERVRLLIVNIVPESFSKALSQFIDSSEPGHIIVEHYLFLSDDTARTVHAITSIFPSFSSPCYSVYAIPSHAQEDLSFSALTASIVAFRVYTGSGLIQEYQLGFTTPQTGHLLHFPDNAGVYAFWSSMLEPAKRLCMPIKRSSPPPNHLDAYLRLCERYSALENNHAIYMLKAGPSVAFISPDILISALKDGISDTPLADAPDISQAGVQLYAVHERRFRNIYQKKRVTHAIMSVRAMRSFLSTGILPDHFFAMRPFTVLERRQILVQLRDQSRDNPYFNVYFMKDDSGMTGIDAACYEPSGVLFHATNTAYDLSANHADALVTLDDFASLFVQFFRDTLLAHMVMSASASVDLLTSMIDSLGTT